MNDEEHKQRHIELHAMLDELVADFIGCTGNLPSKTTVMDLMKWTFEQTKIPDSVGLSNTEEG